MASTLECVGLGVADPAGLADLLDAVLPHASVLGRAAGGEVLRWQDTTGARLVVWLRAQQVIDLLPSFAAETRLRLAGLAPANDEVATAAVVDQHGEQLTSLALELEERRLLDPMALQDVVSAGVVALGVRVEVFADEDAFTASPASLLDPGGADAGTPPPHYAERGWAWPPRLAAESFISHGVFASGAAVEAYARLAATVLRAHAHRVAVTGGRFAACVVRTAGFEVDLCLPLEPDEAPPAAGAIVAGEVFLVGSIPEAAA